MTSVQALSLGLVEGISEYLPISANAHVIILGHLFHLDAALVRSFGVALQAAPALAVLLLYWRRFDALFRPSKAGATTFKGAQAWSVMALVTFPVLVCGVLFKRYFYGLMEGPLPSVAGLAAGGVAILWAEHHVRGLKTVPIESVTLRLALGVGLFQCLALWPGVSRSGATIIGGLLLGLDRKAAAEFSFLAGVPVFLAAAAKELLDAHHALSHLSPGAAVPESVWTHPRAFALAFAVSFAIALVTVKLLIQVLGRISFRPFGWYRLALSPLLYYFFS